MSGVEASAGRLKRGLAWALGPLARTLTGRRARILMYHRFAEVGTPRHTGSAQFDEHLRYIAAHFKPARLADVVARLRAGEPLDDRTVVITVDDGYADFYEHAYPALRRHGIPATVYVVSEFISGRQWLWFDAIRWLVYAAPAGRCRMTFDGLTIESNLDSDAQREALWSRFAGHCVTLPPARQWELIGQLQDGLQTALPERPPAEFGGMTWEQVRSLDPALVEVGAHTRTHPILSLCSVEEQREEIAGCKQAIEDRTGRSVSAFCYPNGMPDDFTDDTVRIVRECGFSSAVMACGGMLAAAPDPYRLERVGAPSDVSQFRHCIDGLWEIKRALARRAA